MVPGLGHSPAESCRKSPPIRLSCRELPARSSSGCCIQREARHGIPLVRVTADKVGDWPGNRKKTSIVPSTRELRVLAGGSHSMGSCRRGPRPRSRHGQMWDICRLPIDEAVSRPRRFGRIRTVRLARCRPFPRGTAGWERPRSGGAEDGAVRHHPPKRQSSLPKRGLLPATSEERGSTSALR